MFIVNYRFTALFGKLVLLFIIANFNNKAIAATPSNLNHNAKSIISSNEEVILGSLLRHKLLHANIIMDHLLLHEYINQLGRTLLINLPQSDLNKFHFFVINNDEINAFAFMGGNIGIFAGLINITANESELAAILAHEISHISQQHFTKELLYQKRLLPITILEAIAAIAIGVPELITPILGGHLQQLLTFSRIQEREADHMGIEILHKSQFNPLGMANIFERMSKLENNSQQIPEYLLTHPLFTSRIAEAYQKIKPTSYQQYKNSFDYQLIKKIIANNLIKNKQDLLTNLNILLQQYTSRPPVDLLYQKALLLKNLYQYKESKQLLEPLVAAYPENLIIQTSLAEVLLHLDPTLAKKHLAPLSQLHPDYLPIVINYALTLLELGLPQETIKILEKFNTDHIYELLEIPKFYELLIGCYQKLNAKSEALFTQAKLMIINNQLDMSEEKLKAAIIMAKQQSNSKILNRIIKFQGELTAFKEDLKAIKF